VCVRGNYVVRSMVGNGMAAVSNGVSVGVGVAVAVAVVWLMVLRAGIL